ncbi:hypothetical protein EVC03_075 [Rhizobium phage RHph_Y5A]|nr:hypothetical protein EVC03_075 [Rhizobium phage RHph_Y5A]QIG75517.1 hypothetical protein EVC18_075 [Rhizobium phage RHph_Y2_4]
MTIVHQRVKLRYANIYEPETASYDGKPHVRPMSHVIAYESDNPDRPELPWRNRARSAPDHSPYVTYRSSARVRITLRDGDYESLAKVLDAFRARNIAPDVLFKGAYADIVVAEYQKPDETILQLSELIFETIEALNIDGDV